jgi:hypothetical protein
MGSPGRALAPGTYGLEGGRGELVIRATVNGWLTFRVSTVSLHGNVCDLPGNIPPGSTTSVIEDEHDNPRCVVELEPTARGVSVDITAGRDACLQSCGAGGTVSGEFELIPAACGGELRSAADAAFKEAYQRKAFAEARAILEPQLRDCGKFLWEADQADLRNDLAVTMHHLGQDAECLATLEPLRKLTTLSDVEIEESSTLYQAGHFKQIAKAARYNLRLCGKK